MSKVNKILLAAVIVLFVVLVATLIWREWFATPTYSAVYLRTGDLYFGELVKFPSFGLKNVYLLQVNQQDAKNPISIQKFTNIIWGPEDFIKINRDEVIWTSKLRADSQLAKVLKENPDLRSSPENSIPQNNQVREPAPAN